MKRGDIVILNLGGNVSKPRPAIIIQAEARLLAILGVK